MVRQNRWGVKIGRRSPRQRGQYSTPKHKGGITTEALLAQIAVSKYADGLPLYRQEAIYAQDKVEPDRKLMAQWMGKLGF
ncbi:transposase [Rhizobium soli]|uniref:Transposase n=1 Tax=Rhizobium soli TaxID=424798 RepID=A0A7X0JNY1_9HYPH|nr:transposase [Rhizobium soli]MBB6511120.1 transposase [Rhizobium soli]